MENRKRTIQKSQIQKKDNFERKNLEEDNSEKKNMTMNNAEQYNRKKGEYEKLKPNE